MENIKTNFAQNLIKLRLSHNLTQSELAKKLNYTDKSISKWENCESVPPLEVIKEIADTFGVTIDYLISSNPENLDRTYNLKQNKTNKLIITLLSTSLVWLVATMLYFYGISFHESVGDSWMVFIYAIPISCVVLLVFNSIWGKKILNFVLISVLIWTLITSIFLTMRSIRNIWTIFIIGIPLQIATILWANLKTNK